jgi:Cu-Zn family superoxide dismutase
MQLDSIMAGAVALAAATALGLASFAYAQHESVEVKLIDSEGKQAGTARLADNEAGLQVSIRAKDLSRGGHGVHIHDRGACEPPDFKSAGSHYAPDDRNHGFLDSQGPHAGDMPMLMVDADGKSHDYHYTTDRVSLDEQSLLGPEGSALVIHAEADDYLTDTGGGTGDRIVCGVISPAESPRSR